jgi:hypothetical protein
MTQRKPLNVLLLSTFTLGIYQLFWSLAIKDEMNEKGADIPTGWLLVVPLVNIWWFWKWCEGVAKVTRGEGSAFGTFLSLSLLGPIGAMLVQSKLNGSAAAPAAFAPAT